MKTFTTTIIEEGNHTDYERLNNKFIEITNEIFMDLELSEVLSIGTKEPGNGHIFQVYNKDELVHEVYLLHDKFGWELGRVQY